MLAISLKTEGEAFGDSTDGDGVVIDADSKVNEVVRILHDISNEIIANYVGYEISGNIRDANGNTVGAWVLK